MASTIRKTGALICKRYPDRVKAIWIHRTRSESEPLLPEGQIVLEPNPARDG